MTDSLQDIEAAIQQTETARRLIARKKTKQVSSSDERVTLKATALSWFQTHRQCVVGCVDAALLAPIDDRYRRILAGTERKTLRTRYLFDLKLAKNALVKLRSDVVLVSAGSRSVTTDKSPDLSPLIHDSAMQNVLRRRWQETLVCIEAGAHLAATVMMGGLLEALLLARVNQFTDKKPIFTAKAAPRDKNNKTRALKEWTLKDYIGVARELKWISHATRDVGEVLRDYRNYIHPYKELSHGVEISGRDTQMFWEVSKSIAQQVIASAH